MNDMPDLSTVKVAAARRLRAETLTDPRTVEAVLMDSLEERRVLEEIRRGKRLRLVHEGFTREGDVLELRARLEEIGPTFTYHRRNENGCIETAEIATAFSGRL